MWSMGLTLPEVVAGPDGVELRPAWAEAAAGPRGAASSDGIIDSSCVRRLLGDGSSAKHGTGETQKSALARL